MHLSLHFIETLHISDVTSSCFCQSNHSLIDKPTRLFVKRYTRHTVSSGTRVDELHSRAVATLSRDKPDITDRVPQTVLVSSAQIVYKLRLEINPDNGGELSFDSCFKHDLV